MLTTTDIDCRCTSHIVVRFGDTYEGRCWSPVAAYSRAVPPVGPGPVAVRSCGDSTRVGKAKRCTWLTNPSTALGVTRTRSGHVRILS